jgi:hypothetical protein
MATAIMLLCSHFFFVVHHYSVKLKKWHFAYQIQIQWQESNCVLSWTVNITRLTANYHIFKFTKIFAITSVGFFISLNNTIQYSLVKLHWLGESTLPLGHKTRWLCESADRLAKSSHGVKLTEPKRTKGELVPFQQWLRSTACYCRSVARNFSSTASCDASDRSVAWRGTVFKLVSQKYYSMKSTYTCQPQLTNKAYN